MPWCLHNQHRHRHRASPQGQLHAATDSQHLHRLAERILITTERFGTLSAGRIARAWFTTQPKEPMAMDSGLVSTGATIDPDALRFPSSVPCQVGIHGLHEEEQCAYELLGTTSGSGRCYYKFQTGTYYINSTVYGAANLISNGTPQLPVRFMCLVYTYYFATNYARSVHTTMVPNSRTVTARSGRSIVASTPATLQRPP